MRKTFLKFLAAVASLLPIQAAADASALIIGSANYENYETVPNANFSSRQLRSIERAGFDVVGLNDVDRGSLVRALFQFERDAKDDDMAMLVLSGHFITYDERTWYLPAVSGRHHIFAPGHLGVSVDSILAVLGDHQSNYVVMLNTSQPRNQLGGRLNYGIGTLNPRDNTTVVIGRHDLSKRFLLNYFDNNRSEFVNRARRNNFTVLGKTEDVLLGDNATSISDALNNANDQNAWSRAAAADTLEAYQSYVRDYPTGRYVTNARNAIQAIQNDPARLALIAEQNLDLDATRKRNIQRNLTDLGFNTRGVDGVFGRGTRQAIKNWQAANGLQATGYLQGNQPNLIALQAQSARAQIAAEDRDYWNRTGARGTANGLTAYLERYPDGIFAQRANRQLEQLRNTQTDRLDAAAKQTEDGMGLNALILSLAELRLAERGHNPGQIDGKIDDNTRNAIRSFQRSVGMAQTGYLSPQLMSVLINSNSGR